MSRYQIRAACRGDEEQLLELAQYLNSVNLPNNRRHIENLVSESERSFSGELSSAIHRRFVFVLWDTQEGKAVGTSMIVAQLGRRDAPYIYFDVISEEKYSHLLDKHFHHVALRLGFSYRGPTELGGLVVHPKYRARKARLGLMISYVRLLFIAAQRHLFQDELLAELLPPLEKDGKSLLWEALGRHFTGISYREADLLSSENKEFVRDLFPSGLIYASLLNPQAQSVIGKVGAQTKGVERMLRRIGFRYAERVDPFDGGPHFIANTDDVTLIQDTQRLRFAATGTSTDKALLARFSKQPPYFHAIMADFETQGEHLICDAAAKDTLSLTTNDEVFVLPLKRSTRQEAQSSTT